MIKRKLRYSYKYNKWVITNTYIYSPPTINNIFGSKFILSMIDNAVSAPNKRDVIAALDVNKPIYGHVVYE